MPKSSHERKHHHAKEKTQEGFISNNFRNTMNKNEKIIMGVLVGGIAMFLILSIVVLFGKGGKLTTQSTEQEVPASEKVKVLTTPYPTIPPISDFFMQVNEKRFYPDNLTIKKGHNVTILNIGKNTTTITPTAADSDHNFGEIKVSEEKVIQFDKAGVYRYTRDTKPDQILVITVTE